MTLKTKEIIFMIITVVITIIITRIIVETKVFDSFPTIVVSSPFVCVQSSRQPIHYYDFNQFLRAIRMVESSGRLHPLPGDKGKSIGPYQIQKKYWIDSKIAGKYSDCNNLEYATKVVIAYLNRYQPSAMPFDDLDTISLEKCEILARTHNGGPKGSLKRSTDSYWAKVKKELEKQ